MAEGITPRQKDFSQWYIDVCIQAELADYSPVRGCMVIRPNGYAMWENVQKELDAMIKETGHENAYFPLFVPKSFLSKEAAHVDGFAKECAVVTHYRLKNDPNGKGVIVDPEAKLEEELIVRPTSETIIWSMYKKWIQSYRDLPLLLNQWANVTRWEMRTRLFLRTTEFLWQEGHTAHATFECAEVEAKKMLDVYVHLAREYLALAIVPGRKTEPEKFAGANHTYTIEAFLQDHKALQAGTSHHLGQNFAKAFDVQFQTETGDRQYVYATSWGLSTRIIGAVIMTHADDNGMIMPPRIAGTQMVVVPIYKTAEERKKVLDYVAQLEKSLKGKVRFRVDRSENVTPGFKFAHWECKGVPLRMEIGPKDVEKNQVCLVRRDLARGEAGQKSFVSAEHVLQPITETLNAIQDHLRMRAEKKLKENTFFIRSYDELKRDIEGKPGFYIAPFAGGAPEEERIKEELGVTARCIPFEYQNDEEHPCFLTGTLTKTKVLFAKAY
jgi:prolyl-tRNA synthetase